MCEPCKPRLPVPPHPGFPAAMQTGCGCWRSCRRAASEEREKRLLVHHHRRRTGYPSQTPARARSACERTKKALPSPSCWREPAEAPACGPSRACTRRVGRSRAIQGPGDPQTASLPSGCISPSALESCATTPALPLDHLSRVESPSPRRFAPDRRHTAWSIREAHREGTPWSTSECRWSSSR